MNQLIAVRHDHRAVTPVTFANAHRVRDMDPTWGLYPHLRPNAFEPVHLDLPTDDVLAIMELELIDIRWPGLMGTMPEAGS